MENDDYVIQVLGSPLDIQAREWDALLQTQSQPTPFMQHAYLAALHTTGRASATTGWRPRFVTLRDGDGQLVAACPFYVKTHSRGEYVFDWAWADAYHRHGLAYYPKGLVAVPFTPAPGSRLLAITPQARRKLVGAIHTLCAEEQLSSWHLLFGSTEDLSACQEEAMTVRYTVQFHWENRPAESYASFEDYLGQLTQAKRKKIRQERRKVAEAGVTLRAITGQDITPDALDFFYSCYERTYLEHGNPPYLNRAFFAQIFKAQPEHWLLFIAKRNHQPIACSLIALQPHADPLRRVAWGRYWGAMERVDCLHFEACYYAPLQWCIEQGYQRFEGGAQGEHKLARALLPVKTQSAHWIAHPDFSAAIQEFLVREREGIAEYVNELEQHAPLKLVEFKQSGDEAPTA
jgi:predicted N-acyltransferase